MKNRYCGGRHRAMLEPTCHCRTPASECVEQRCRCRAQAACGSDAMAADMPTILQTLINGAFNTYGCASWGMAFGLGQILNRSLANCLLALPSPVGGNPHCEPQSLLRDDAAARTCGCRQPKCNALATFGVTLETRIGFSAPSETSLCKCRRCSRSPRQAFRSERLAARMLQNAASGTAAPEVPESGYPISATANRSFASNCDETHARLLGGISAALRATRHEHSVRAENQLTFTKQQGKDMSTEMQDRNRNPEAAQSNAPSSGPRNSSETDKNEASRPEQKNGREPGPAKRINAFAWDNSAGSVKDKTRRVALCESRPAEPKSEFEGLDAAIRSDIKSTEFLQILDRPASEIVEPRIKEHGENRLTLWLPFDTPLNAVWAAESALGQFSIKAAKRDDRIKRIILTTGDTTDYGYAPYIKWSFTPKDKRFKTVRPSETKHFLHYLQYVSAGRTGDKLQDEFELKLLITVSNSVDVQFRASDELIRHADRNGFLQKPLEAALDDFKEFWKTLEGERRDFNPPTRWDVIKMLRERGHLLPTDRKQSSLRPASSSALVKEIARILERTHLCSYDTIRSSSRTDGAVRARYIAGQIMRSTTSRPLAQIGESLGNRDHSTVVHGLRQIDAWANDRPVNARFLDMFCQLADNIGICNSLRNDPEMKRRLTGRSDPR